MSYSMRAMMTLSRPLFGLLVTALVLYLAVCLLLFLVQRSLIYLPPQGPPGFMEGLASLTLPGGVEVQISRREVEGRGALLYFGGNAEDVSWSLPELAEAFPDRALYLLHYPGYSGATGKPSEAVFHARARALFDEVAVRHPEVTVIGRSLGSGVAVRLAVERPVAKLILVTPYDSLAALGAEQFPGFPVRWLARDPFRSDRYAPRVIAPTLLLIAERDEVIPTAHSRRLFEAFAPGIARWQVLPGVGHNSISESREYLQALRSGG